MTTTTVDTEKATAEVRIVSATSTGYVIRTGVEVYGRGIRRIAPDTYAVTDKAMDKIQASHTFATDF